MAYNTIITGGTVYTPTGPKKVDVGITGQKVAAVRKGLVKNGLSTKGGRSTAKVIDATGKYVIPGGLDVHVHLELPFCGTVSSDDFDSGTRAAARGGVTSVIDFAIPYGKESMTDAYNNWRKKADPKTCIDYCFHMAITNWDRHGPEMAKMVKRGCPTFKEFMIYESEGWQSDDRAIFGALENCKKLNAMLLIHAESSRVLDELIDRHHNKAMMKKYGAQLHAMTRPNYIEAEAIQRAVKWAEVTGGTLYVVHMSTGEGTDIIEQARKKKIPVLAETCAQYLVLDDSLFAEKDGHLYACCPQIKKKPDQKRLWEGLKKGDVCVVSTDTCSFTRKQKAMWKGDWTKIPMGMPGLETLLPIVYTHGVLRKRLTMQQFVEKCCSNPAKVMGLYPKKGVVAPGSDADVVIFDPKKRIKVDHKKMDTNTDWSPFQDWSLAGFAETTFSRGRKIVDDYQFCGKNGWGKWMSRKTAGKL